MEVPPLTLEDLERAWERVAENAGCAGADGVTCEEFEGRRDVEYAALLAEVQSGSYFCFPLLRIAVEKKAGSAKIRRLMVPSVRDRVLQTAVARRLSRSFEEEFLDSSFAYRPGRGVDRAIARLRRCRDGGWPPQGRGPLFPCGRVHHN